MTRNVDQYLSLGSLLISTLTLAGGGLAWAMGWGKRRAEQKKEEALEDKLRAETYQIILAAANALTESLRQELAQRDKRIQDLEDTVARQASYIKELEDRLQSNGIT